MANNNAQNVTIKSNPDFNELKLKVQGELLGTNVSFSEYTREAVKEKWERDQKLKQVGK